MSMKGGVGQVAVLGLTSSTLALGLGGRPCSKRRKEVNGPGLRVLMLFTFGMT